MSCNHESNRGPFHVVIVGGGISGLSAAERLLQSPLPFRVTLLEATNRLGGIVRTERVDDLVIEHGPDVALATKPAIVRLAHQTGLTERLQTANSAGAFVGTPHGLRRLPPGMAGIVPHDLQALRASRILTAKGILRVEAESRIGPDATTVDESIESFAVRRVGRECYERIVEPLLTGIHAGDGARLSMEATFPRLRQLEREFGSLYRANALGAMRSTGSAGSPFVSFPLGLEELVDGVVRKIEHDERMRIVLRTQVNTIRDRSALGDRRPVVHLDSGEALQCDAIIMASPARVTATLLRAVCRKLADEFDAIGMGSTTIVTLAFGARDVHHPLDGTGYVLPRYLRRDAIACTWSSSKFEGRAPGSMRLFRVFLGGAHRPELMQRDDAELSRLARVELQRELGITASPKLIRVVRWLKAMPQFHVGHVQRLERIAGALEAHPWLAIAGNVFQGVGISDCIASGERAADAVTQQLVHVAASLRS